MTADTLFPDCPLPGCTNPVDDPRQPCRDCLEAFGPYLASRDDSEPAPVGEYAAMLAARDQTVRGVLDARRTLTAAPAATAIAPVEWRMNQRCWLCEARSKCRPDPDYPDRWMRDLRETPLRHPRSRAADAPPPAAMRAPDERLECRAYYEHGWWHLASSEDNRKDQ